MAEALHRLLRAQGSGRTRRVPMANSLPAIEQAVSIEQTVCSLILASCALVSCGTSDLPEPGADGPVKLWHWADSNSMALRLVASQARIPRPHTFELDDVRVVAPLENGWLAVQAAHGEISENGGDMLLSGDAATPRVVIHGVLDQRPIRGTAASARTPSDRSHIIIMDALLSHGGSTLDATELLLWPNQRYQGQTIRRQQEGTALQTLQAAQPHTPKAPAE